MAADQFNKTERTIMQQTEKRPAEDVLEREAGGQFHQALVVTEARAACESAYENFRYDDDFPSAVLAAYKLISETEISV